MKKEINQNKLLLDYMRNGGYAIGDYYAEANNRYGDKVRYKVYYLKGATNACCNA